MNFKLAAKGLPLDFDPIIRSFKEVMAENNIEGKILGVIVIPDYHRIYKIGRKWYHTFVRHEILHDDPPILKCFCKKRYINEVEYEKEMLKLDFQTDIEHCRELKGSTLAFIAFDSVSVAKQIQKFVKYIIFD